MSCEKLGFSITRRLIRIRAGVRNRSVTSLRIGDCELRTGELRIAELRIAGLPDSLSIAEGRLGLGESVGSLAISLFSLRFCEPAVPVDSAPVAANALAVAVADAAISNWQSAIANVFSLT